MSADSRQAEHGTDIPALEGPGSGGPVGPAPSDVSQERIVLRLEDVSMRYGAVRALGGVNFVARQGEVVGLVGDNGAGKSTMVKVIAGTITPETGRIFVDDVERRWESPHAALAAGIETVFQDGGLAPHLSVASNLFLGREISQHRDFSEETARQIDLEVRRLIDEAYQSAHTIVSANSDAMHRLAAALLERETIDAEEVRMLIEGKELPPLRSILASPSDTGGSVQQVLKPETRGGPSFPEGSPSPA